MHIDEPVQRLRASVRAEIKSTVLRRWRDKREFKARVQEWAVKLDLKVATVYVRPMHGKWASCYIGNNR
jgi:predicted metal-dependent hydrolase